MKNYLSILAGIILATSYTNNLQASIGETIDFTTLTSTTSLASLNVQLASYGVSVDAGLPDTLSVGGGDDLSAQTDPSAADLLFNFGSAISSISVNFDGPGSTVGITGFDINTTAANANGLEMTGDDLGGINGTEGTTVTFSHSGMKSLQVEDLDSFVDIQSITLSPVPTPEPTTCGLLAVGAVAALGARFRRQRQ